MGSASIQKHQDATCHETIVELEKGSHMYESMCTPELESCWRDLVVELSRRWAGLCEEAVLDVIGVDWCF